MAKKRVLIIDDSALMRQLLTQILNGDPDLEVVGTAGDPYEGWDKLQKTKPHIAPSSLEIICAPNAHPHSCPTTID